MIISKINCGGRAYKNGLKQNDEIIAVNSLEINKHPLTLVRHTEDNKDCKCLNFITINLELFI